MRFRCSLQTLVDVAVTNVLFVTQSCMFRQITPHFVRSLERRKHVVESQLRDLEWRLDQESKVRQSCSQSELIALYTLVE